MVTYIYWATVIGLMLTAVFLIGIKLKSLMSGVIGSIVVLAVGRAAYYFHFEQLLVKRWGSVMTITIPEGHTTY